MHVVQGHFSYGIINMLKICNNLYYNRSTKISLKMLLFYFGENVIVVKYMNK